MVIHTMYKRKIKHYNHIFDDTVRLYRGAVDYLISVCIGPLDGDCCHTEGTGKEDLRGIHDSQDKG